MAEMIDKGLLMDAVEHKLAIPGDELVSKAIVRAVASLVSVLPVLDYPVLSRWENGRCAGCGCCAPEFCESLYCPGCGARMEDPR